MFNSLRSDVGRIAFAVTAAVYSPATATVTGAVRGVMPFVSAVEGRRSETEEVPCSPPGW